MPTIDLRNVPDRVSPKFRVLLKRHEGIRFFVCYGGAGASKSYSITQAIVYRCLAEGGHKLLVSRKVGRSLKHSVVSLLRHVVDEWGMPDLVTYNRTDHTMTFWSGSQIIFTGLDDPDKLKSIHGVTGIWVEEADEISHGDFQQLNLRLRGKTEHAKRFYLSFNPVNVSHWIKRELIDRNRDNVMILHATYRDNPYIDTEYMRELGSITDEYYRAVYVEGEWGELGNVVFTDYVIEDFDYTERDLENVVQGLDFGYNHPSVAIRAGMRDGEIYVFAETMVREQTNADFINAVKEMDPRYSKHVYIADSAEPDRIAEFKQVGFMCEGAKKGKDSVRHGIDWLKRHRLHIHAEKCPRLAKEIQAYKWREDRSGNTIDEPVAFFDDAIAALRYATEPLRLQTSNWNVLARW